MAADVIREYEVEESWVQGYHLATMLREHLGNATGKIDPDAILDKWGVTVKQVVLSGSMIDAVAVWEHRHHPTILVNSEGPRAKTPSGTRSTLAHEICHLLVDLNAALPAVEALGGNVPWAIERRSNAFAAELLLPRAEARRYMTEELHYIYGREERNRCIKEGVNILAETYGTSHETTAWQVLNAGCLDVEDKAVLKEYLKSIYKPLDR